MSDYAIVFHKVYYLSLKMELFLIYQLGALVNKSLNFFLRHFQAEAGFQIKWFYTHG
jgi:hypothetical protein